MVKSAFGESDLVLVPVLLTMGVNEQQTLGKVSAWDGSAVNHVPMPVYLLIHLHLHMPSTDRSHHCV